MEIYKKLFRYTPERISYAYGTVVLSVVAAVLSMIPFWYLWKFLKELIVLQDMERTKFYALLIIAMMIANAIVYFLALVVSHLLAFRLETNLRKEGIAHLLRASFAFFDTNSSGRIRKIIDDNAVDTHMIVAHLIPDVTTAIVSPIMMIGITFAADYRLGILLIVVLIITMLQMKSMMGDREFMKKYTASLEKMNSEAVEYVRGMQVVKIFRTTVYSFKTFYDTIMSYSKDALDYSMSCRKGFVSFQVILALFGAATIPVGIVLMNQGAPVADIFAKIIFFACFAGMMFTCLMKIMYVGMFQYQADMAVSKLEEIFGQMQKNALLWGSEEKFENCSIEFCDVSFKYEEDYVLQNLNLKLEEGKTYALVGSSGGGKSTIAKLISGFYKINEGELRIGGKSIDSYSEHALMKNIAFVFQHSKLFKMSIYDNVKLGNPSATDEEIKNALTLAQCDFVEKLKDKEHTVIGSKGVYLSGGETQRIAIARAILKNANIVILDEASAATDPENEYELQQAFSNLMKGKTVIMIAHRLTTIRKVDEILVVDNGQIVERGSDQELMALGGRYKTLQEIFTQANSWRVYDK